MSQLPRPPTPAEGEGRKKRDMVSPVEPCIECTRVMDSTPLRSAHHVPVTEATHSRRGRGEEKMGHGEPRRTTNRVHSSDGFDSATLRSPCPNYRGHPLPTRERGGKNGTW